MIQKIREQHSEAFLNDYDGTLEEMLTNTPGGFASYIITDSSIHLMYMTQGIIRLSGYSEEDYRAAFSRNPFCFIFDEDISIIKNHLDNIYLGGNAFNCDYRIRTKNGSIKWINMRCSVKERRQNDLILNTFQFDITTQKVMEEANRIHEQELKLAMLQMGKVICEYDIKTHSLTMPADYAAKYNLPMVLTDIPFSTRQSCYLEESYQKSYKGFYQEILRGDKGGTFDAHIMYYDGTWHWEHYDFVNIFGNDGKPAKALIYIEDTTKQQEMKLQYENELQLRHELIDDSIIYYQFNLTTEELEEYRSKSADNAVIHPGMDLKHILDIDIMNAIVEEDRELVKSNIYLGSLRKKYYHGETRVRIEYRRKVPNLGIRWVRAVVTIMKRPGDENLIAFLYVKDIDVEKKNQIALDSILNEEIESVCVLNVKTTMAHFLNIRDEHISVSKNEIFHFNAYIMNIIQTQIIEEEREASIDFFLSDHLNEALKDEASIMFTYRMLTAEQQIQRKQVIAFFLDELKEEIVLSQRDITDLYEIEQRQKKSLEEAVETANRANHAKSEFLSRMSHDMRTPLNAILALSGKEMTEDADYDIQKDYLDKIHSSGEYLLGLINDVLDMAKIESNKMTLLPVAYSFEEFQRTIKTVIGESCQQKGIHFAFKTNGVVLPYIMVDRIRFNQIFINLLSNAVKFTPAGGTIEFALDTIVTKDNLITGCFTVRDTGSGMSPEFLPHAFDSFSQETTNPSKCSQGTGLGLSIVKSLVTLMGGTISVESELGKGTIFTVLLSYEGAESPEKIPDTGTNIDVLSSVKVLLCEDHILNAQITIKLLEKKGCIIDHAENGKIGFEKFREAGENYYDIILMDLRMPIMNGLQSAKMIRSLKRADSLKIPIVALTADAFSNDERLALDVGMDGHVSKPISPQVLYETIAKLVKK